MKHIQITHLIYLLLGILLFSCSKENAVENSYELVSNGFSVQVEQFDSLNTDPNRYNHNNEIYKIGRKWKYDYVYKDANGQRKSFEIDADNKSEWTFVDDHTQGVQYVQLEVLSGLKPMIDWMPDYNQTLISYSFLPSEVGFNITGTIENEANLWTHPPRGFLFKILELNPFPFIQHELIDSTWTYAIAAGAEQYADARWATWEGAMRVDSEYEKIGEEQLNTPLGKLLCSKVKGIGKSSLGETHLTAWYNEQFGFVQLDYINIDKSTLSLLLSEVIEPEN